MLPMPAAPDLTNVEVDGHALCPSPLAAHAAAGQAFLPVGSMLQRQLEGWLEG
jgi:hypothetical protein